MDGSLPKEASGRSAMLPQGHFRQLPRILVSQSLGARYVGHLSRAGGSSLAHPPSMSHPGTTDALIPEWGRGRSNWGMFFPLFSCLSHLASYSTQAFCQSPQPGNAEYRMGGRKNKPTGISPSFNKCLCPTYQELSGCSVPQEVDRGYPQSWGG
jgi:hypothetical protein